MSPWQVLQIFLNLYRCNIFLTQLEDILFNILFSLTIVDVMAGGSSFSGNNKWESWKLSRKLSVILIITTTTDRQEFNVPDEGDFF